MKTAEKKSTKKPEKKAAETPAEVKVEKPEKKATKKVEKPVEVKAAKVEKLGPEEDAKKAVEEIPQETPKKSENTKVKKFDPKWSEDFCKEVEESFVKGIYGLYDPNNKACIDCSKDEAYRAAFEACKYNTEMQAKIEAASKPAPKAKKDTPKEESAPKKESAPKGEKSLLGHVRSSCDLDNILFRPEGASVEEIQAIRPSFQSHLYHLKKEHGAKIVKKDGRYYATI